MKYFVLVLFAAVLWAGNALGQSQKDTVKITVTGKVVKKADGETPIPYADILFKGKARGTFTDAEGQFTLQGFASDTSIIVSLEGYSPEEIRLDPENYSGIVVQLGIQPELINNGYYTEERRYVTSAISKVKSEELAQNLNMGFDAGLQGKVAGLHVLSQSGMPGSAVNMRIRGASSVIAGGEPLIVVDGVPLTQGANGDGGGAIGATYGWQSNPVAELNANDIESVEVLKDAAATALYGARGGNGVIVVTTKQGKPGKTRFNLSYQAGPIVPTNRVNMANSQQYRDAIGQAYRNSFGSDPTGASGRYLAAGDSIFGFNNGLAQSTNTDWLNKNLRNGLLQQATLNITGGTKRVSFYASGDYRREEGTVIGTKHDRIALRFNAENKATDKLKIGVRTQLMLSFSDFMPAGLDTSAGFGVAQTRALPVYPVFLPNGVIDPINITNSYFNPYRAINSDITQQRELYKNERNVFRTLASMYGEYEILKNLVFRTEGGIDYYTNNDRTFRSGLMRLTRAIRPRGDTLLAPTAAATDFRQLFFSLNSTSTLRYTTSFGDEDQHKLMLLAGNQYYQNLSTLNGSGSERFPNEYSPLTSAGAIGFGRPVGLESGFAYLAWFGKAGYSFRDKYFINLVSRAESSTRFGENVGYEWYPAVSAAWVLTNESFLEGLKEKAGQVKLRLSYGSVGNSLYLNTQAQGVWRGGFPYVDPETFNPGRAPFQLANTLLVPERNNQFDLGIDWENNAGSIRVGLDYYIRQTTGVALAFPLPASLGVVNSSVVENRGVITNSGLELTINTTNVNTKLFRWTTDLTLATNSTVVNDLSGLNSDQTSNFNGIRVFEGNGLGTFFINKWAGFADSDDPNGRWRRGDELLFDKDGNRFRPTSIGQMDSNRVAIENKFIQPTLYGGINNTFRVGDFELGVFFTYSLGRHVLDYGEFVQSYANGKSNLRAEAVNSGGNLYYNDVMANRITDRFLHDASYVRLRNLHFAWHLPENWCRKNGLAAGKLFLNTQNLLTFTGYKGWDPESMTSLGLGMPGNLGLGMQALDLPQNTIFTGGFSITF